MRSMENQEEKYKVNQLDGGGRFVFSVVYATGQLIEFLVCECY